MIEQRQAIASFPFPVERNLRSEAVEAGENDGKRKRI